MITETVKQYIPKDAIVTFFGNSAVFEVPLEKIKDVISHIHHAKTISLKLITATDERERQGCFKIWYIFGVPKKNVFIILFIQLKNTEKFPSITPLIHEAGLYERRIQSFFGLIPVGHPDPRPIILHENWPSDVFPLRKDFPLTTRPAKTDGTYEFQKVEGEGIYEIPVGPIHAGIIEPGHFRFSVAGEEIVHLEARLGFTHKGSEKLFEMLPLDQKIRLSEKISGDSSFSHSLAFCQAVEQLGGILPPQRALHLRVVYAELERLANHCGDIGAIMIDTGFNFGGAQGARIREMIVQINERLTGSRFLRGVNTIGGVKKDIDIETIPTLFNDLTDIEKDFAEIIKIAENSSSLYNRLKDTGVLSYEIAKDNGVTGVAAKAVGIENDTRLDFPYAAYNTLKLERVETEPDGDVHARFRVRIKEVFASIALIQNALTHLPKGPIHMAHSDIKLRENSLSVSIVEGWRGEIIYFVATDAQGNISRVAPRDPSFLNWSVLGDVGFGNVVPDFPLINKSFNLSYSGNDL